MFVSPKASEPAGTPKRDDDTESIKTSMQGSSLTSLKKHLIANDYSISGLKTMYDWETLTPKE
jgi:hypothetical protein